MGEEEEDEGKVLCKCACELRRRSGKHSRRRLDDNTHKSRLTPPPFFVLDERLEWKLTTRKLSCKTFFGSIQVRRRREQIYMEKRFAHIGKVFMLRFVESLFGIWKVSFCFNKQAELSALKGFRGEHSAVMSSWV